MLEVKFIDHSGFLVETEHALCLFDYYRGEIPELPLEKKLYVFVSHRHADHFNPEIFKLRATHPQVHYIISKDVPRSPGKLKTYGIDDSWKPLMTVAFAHEVYQIDGLRVQTLRSTDAGVAYAVTVDGHTVYHAGDLNWWTWEGEESEQEYQDMTKRFQNEIALIAATKFEVAFLPLDPRQGDRFYWGFDYFMRHVETERAVPMHCWNGDFSVVEQLRGLEVSAPYREKISWPLSDTKAVTSGLVQ